jgi:hypothetical protein
VIIHAFVEVLHPVQTPEILIALEAKSSGRAEIGRNEEPTEDGRLPHWSWLSLGFEASSVREAVERARQLIDAAGVGPKLGPVL